jgi:NitT/TauT family transport system permease protein
MLEQHPKTKHWQALAALMAWLVLWQLVYWLVRQDLLLASPLQVFGRLGHLMMQPDFWLAALWSMLRIQAGFLIGVLAGTLLAIATTRSAWLLAFFQPAIRAIRATPVASFIILAFFWMTSSHVVVFIVFLMVLPIVWANVSEGIHKTSPQLLEMARVFRMSRSQVIRLIYLPSVSPFFIAAASTSLGLGWKAGIAAEVISTPNYSLGGRLYDAKTYLETADLLAFTLIIILMSLLLEKALVWVFRRAEAYFGHHGQPIKLAARSANLRNLDSEEQRPDQDNQGGDEL